MIFTHFATPPTIPDFYRAQCVSREKKKNRAGRENSNDWRRVHHAPLTLVAVVAGRGWSRVVATLAEAQTQQRQRGCRRRREQHRGRVGVNNRYILWYGIYVLKIGKTIRIANK